MEVWRCGGVQTHASPLPHFHTSTPPTHPRVTRFLLYHAPVLAWMGVIFVFSTGLGTAEHTIGLLQRFLETWFPEAAKQFSPVQLEYLNYIIRKLAHATEYAILTLLALRA